MQQQQQQNSSSRISLISKSDIRYEGLLHSINPEDNTVTLSSVRMRGTEGRRRDQGAEEVPATEQLYEFIVFRGSDIKDLTVYEQQGGASGTSAPQHTHGQGTGGHSASQSHSHHQAAGAWASPINIGQNASSRPHNQQSVFTDSIGERNQSGGGSRQHDFYDRPQQSWGRQRYGNDHSQRDHRNDHSGDYRNSNRVNQHTGQNFRPRGSGRETASAAVPVKAIDMTEEFEFKELDKTKLEQEFNQSHSGEAVYNKTGFFDSISCEATIARDREDRFRQRNIDMQTFGTTAAAGYGYGGRGYRGRGRGRGGRGR